MVAWLNLHGVSDRYEILQWEEWFVAIGSYRARVQEELMPTSGTDNEREDQED